MNVVIIGGGLAGAQTARALREAGHEGSVTLLASENHLPYERPPLSKKYLAGEAAFEKAIVRPASWYEEQHIDLRLGATARSIDRSARLVTLADGGTVPYERLVLATGSRPRTLGLGGADSANVFYLRTVDDADAIRGVIGPDRSLVIIGGGWIGLEVAATARQAGTAVTIIERSEAPLAGVLGVEMGRVFGDLHRSHGTEIRAGVEITQFVTESGRVTGVALDNGEVVHADAVVVGIGVTPDVTLAQEAGLAVDNGVLVDASLRTSDPHIWAVGDIANHDHPVLGQRVRVEHWATALRQPRTAAAALLGSDSTYTRLPYFFSDQYDLGMEYVGHAPPGSDADVVVRGDLEARKFVAFWLAPDDRILAAMNVNVWEVPKQIEPLIAAGTKVDRAKLADADVGIDELG